MRDRAESGERRAESGVLELFSREQNCIKNTVWRAGLHVFCPRVQCGWHFMAQSTVLCLHVCMPVLQFATTELVSLIRGGVGTDTVRVGCKWVKISG